jgi:hypothetical protein
VLSRGRFSQATAGAVALPSFLQARPVAAAGTFYFAVIADTHINAYLIVEADTKAVTHQLLNLDLADWHTHFSKPYQRS